MCMENHKFILDFVKSSPVCVPAKIKPKKMFALPEKRAGGIIAPCSLL